MNRREALRGAEEDIFDVLAEILTSKQWAKLLNAPLGRAVAEGMSGLAQKLVRAGAEIGGSLRAAVRGGHERIVNDMLENGVSATVKDSHGCTPLHCAAKGGNTEMVQLLLLKGVDKDAMDNFDCTPLHMAAQFGHVAAALALMAAGADVSLKGGVCKETVLHVAAQLGHVDIMRATIEHEANADAVDKYQQTPLHCAARFNKVGTINVLIEAGANIQALNV